MKIKFDKQKLVTNNILPIRTLLNKTVYKLHKEHREFRNKQRTIRLQHKEMKPWYEAEEHNKNESQN